MSDRNCPNCNAPYDVHLNTCPYCGTSYFDLSAIDFEDRKPIYLKIRTKDFSGRDIYMTQKCVPRLGTISMNNDTVDVTDRYGNFVKSIVCNRYMTTDVSFEAIADTNDSLCEIVIKE